MALIDPEGLFNGDKFEDVSDEARLHWPFFWCASNTLARLELNYHKVIGRAYRRFKTPPTEEQFWAYVKEYFDAYLLFVYEADGSIWGEWNTSKKYLPRHTLTADKRTPAPDTSAFNTWKEEYIEKKRSRSTASSSGINVFVKVSLALPKGVRKVDEDLHTDAQGIGEGVGVGVGVGKVKTICASDDALGSHLDPPPESKTLFAIDAAEDRKQKTCEREKWFHEEFWPIIWAKIGKDAALRSWLKKIKTREQAEQAITAAKAQGPSLLRSAQVNGHSVLHPSTWLHDGRYEDEPVGYTPPRISSAPGLKM